MISIKQTTDLDYIRKTINEPEMREHLTEDIVVTPDEEAAIGDSRNLYYAVEIDEKDCGFVAFTPVAPPLYALHTCTRPIGIRSRIAVVDECLRLARLSGALDFITAFPDDRKDFHRLAQWCGWSFVPAYVATGFYNPVFKTAPAFYTLTRT